jgi:GTP cyclohydrolase I
MEDKSIEDLLRIINNASTPRREEEAVPEIKPTGAADLYIPPAKTDIPAAEAAITQLIRALGGDPTRDGMAETPRRAVKMLGEMFAGMVYTNDEIADKYNKTFADPGTEMVLVKDIGCFSFCEHHFALMYNMQAHIAYIPRGRVVGLSKVARIVDLVSKRFQLQERIGADVAYILEKILGTEDIMVVIEGEHSCMTARGIRAQGAKTRTNTARGRFATHADLHKAVIDQI